MAVIIVNKLIACFTGRKSGNALKISGVGASFQFKLFKLQFQG